MITEDYCSLEVAKLLKEKGFPQHVTFHTYFVGDDKKRGCIVGEFIGHPSAETDIHLIDAPTQQMAMRWLREVHNIDIDIKTDWGINPETGKYFVKCYKYRLHYSDAPNHDINERFDTYEQAAELAIKYCLENLI